MNKQKILENKGLIEKEYKKYSKKVYKKYTIDTNNFFKFLKKEVEKDLYKLSYEVGFNPTKDNLLLRDILIHLINLCVDNLPKQNDYNCKL